MIKSEIYKYLKLAIGCVIGSLGMALILKSNIGSSPWIVFQQGIGKKLDISIGQVMIMVSFILLLMGWYLGELFGSGTILNVLICSYSLDFIIIMDIIPAGKNLFSGIIMVIVGTIILSFGIYLYIHNGLGCGPRDALMVGLVKKTGKSTKIIRSLIEISVLILGYFMGGIIGVGTIIYAVFIGYLLQFIFQFFNFDISELKHRTIKDELILIRNIIYKS